jgi:hypothetical protein
VTYAELKMHLDAFTPEQLAMEVAWSGDERGGKVKRLWVAEEDWLRSGDGDCEPRSVVTANEPDIVADARVLISKGTPHLMVD